MKFPLLIGLYNYIPYTIPVVGVTFFDWDPITVLIYFCIENVLCGIFFLFRGCILMYHRRGRGFMFLVLISLLYFSHVWALYKTISTDIGTSTVLTINIFLINIIILSVPHLIELIHFSRTAKKINEIEIDRKLSKDEKAQQIKQSSLDPMFDFILDIKEMFIRLVVLWFTLGISMIIFTVSAFFINLPSIIYSILLMFIFTFTHYKFESYALKEREKVLLAHSKRKNDTLDYPGIPKPNKL